MILKQMKSSGFQRNFTYIIACKISKAGAVIDPSFESSFIIKELEKEQINIDYIINTHNHPDHRVDNNKLREATGAKIIQHKESNYGDVSVDEGETISLGKLELKFFHTPGHTDLDICIMVNKELFTGDTLFVGKVGGTPDKESAKIQFYSLKKLMNLPDSTNVWPGHDYGVKPSSTIGDEKKNNPFCLRLNDFEEFYFLKENWLEFKEKHGIE